MTDRFTIENEQCAVEISRQAGEVSQYLDKENKIDYCWCGNPGFWANRNPVLFPLLGGVENGQYEYEGHSYHIGNHGVLRYALFDFVSQSDDTVILEKTADEKTLTAYPFNFRLQVTYRLTGKKLDISYLIENKDSKPLPFEVGFHPAFNIPFTADKSFADYQLHFAAKEQMTSTNSFVTVADTDTISLSDPSLFDRSLSFFFDGFKSEYVDLTDGVHSLRVGTAGFGQLGIWHKSPSTPFICIEPWMPKLPLEQKPFFPHEKKANVLPAGSQVSFGYYFAIVK